MAWSSFVDDAMLGELKSKYGQRAYDRGVQLKDLIAELKNANTRTKLTRVNDFFNNYSYRTDQELWKQKDYWATPIEFLGSQGGDCEDFSIAKYFTLKLMGVNEEKLNLTYVKALNYNVHHMVLTYFSTPEAEPLVLDNLDTNIKSASQRKDLIPIYSFNGTGLWLAKQRGKGRLAGSSSRLTRWQDLVERMYKGN